MQAQAVFAQELKSALGMSQLLQAIAELVDLDLSPEELLLRAVELSSTFLKVDWANLAAAENDVAVPVSVWHNAAGASFAQTLPASLHRQMGGLLWRAAGQDQPLFTDDYAATRNALSGAVQAGARGH